jgi:hypothetical protein
MVTRTERAHPQLGTLCAVILALAGGCAADASEPIVGSGRMAERTTDTSNVEKVTVSLPFEAEIGNGEPNRLVVRGEDNLLERIEITEATPGVWRISAAQNLAFTQHEPMQVAIPYVDMVELSLDGDDLVLKDHPSDFWHQGNAAEENGGD